MSAKDFDPFDLCDALLALVRAHNEHITSEYRRCVNGSSAGSGVTSQPQTDPSSPTEFITPPTGPKPLVRPIEDNWWVDQDRDEAWTRHWEEQDLDPIDPKSWK